MGFPPFLDTPLLRTQKMKMIGIRRRKMAGFLQHKKQGLIWILFWVRFYLELTTCWLLELMGNSM